MEDSIVNWILLCIVSFWFLVHFITKGIEENERYRRENDRVFRRCLYGTNNHQGRSHL